MSALMALTRQEILDRLEALDVNGIQRQIMALHIAVSRLDTEDTNTNNADLYAAVTQLETQFDVIAGLIRALQRETIHGESLRAVQQG